MSEKKRRFKPDVRKAQIIEVTKKLIVEKGLAWTTMERVADAINISHTTLYYHFKNRREILVETFKAVMEEIIRTFTGDLDNVEEFFQKSSAMIVEQVQKNPKLGWLFLELLCAPLEDAIHDVARQQISGLHAVYVMAIERGIEQGLFEEDADAVSVSWELMSLIIAVFLGNMLNVPNFMSLEQGKRSIERILGSIKKQQPVE